MRLATLLAILSLTAIAGCDPAPATPTWHDDVKPILVANCIKCHGADPRGGAPSSFRLDRNSNFLNQRGASQIAQFIHVRTHAKEMPPVARLSQRQIDVLENWANNPAEGTPGANAAPEITAEIAQAGETVTISYQVSDADFDTVDWTIQAIAGGAAIDITPNLRGGSGEFVWETDSALEGEYRLLAIMSDEVNTDVQIGLGDVTIDRNGGDTAPTLFINSPASKTVISDAESPFTVEVRNDDPDGDAADVTVSLVRGTDRIELATGLVPVSLDPTPIEIDTTSVPEGPGWTLVVESGVASARAENIIIGHGAPETSFAPIQTILDTYCAGCHGPNPAVDNVIPLALDERDVYAFRGGYYTRVVREQSMPPKSAELLLDQGPMPARDREALKRWLLTAPNRNP